MHGHVVICVRVLQGLFEVRNPSNQPTNQLTKFDFATDQSRGLRLRDVAKMGRVRFCFMIKQICEMETCPKPSKGWGSYQGKGKITKAFILMRFLCVRDWGVCHFSLTEGQEGYFVKRMFAHSILAVANHFIVCHSYSFMELFNIQKLFMVQCIFYNHFLISLNSLITFLKMLLNFNDIFGDYLYFLLYIQ